MIRTDGRTVEHRLARARQVVIVTHDRPDGDAAGALLGLARILRGRGQEACLACNDPIPDRYAFLLRGEEVRPLGACRPSAPGAVLAVLDCGACERVAGLEAWDRSAAPILNIDHHHSNTGFGDANWVESEASSVSEMILDLAEAAGWPVPRAAAEALWVGLVTDTGRFSYENATAAALRAGARLVELGASPARLNESVYESRTLRELRLTARAMQTLETGWAGRVAWVSLGPEDFAATGCGPADASETVNIPRSLQSVRAGLFFYEVPAAGETKVSIRAAHPLEATELAARFGGGGHRRAAGCSVPEPLAAARDRVLAAIEAVWGPVLRGHVEAGEEEAR